MVKGRDGKTERLMLAVDLDPMAYTIYCFLTKKQATVVHMNQPLFNNKQVTLQLVDPFIFCHYSR